MNNLRDTDLLIKFGERLKQLRTERGYTLEALAFEAEMELSQIHRIEKAKINPTLTTMSALAKAFNLTLAELMGEL